MKLFILLSIIVGVFCEEVEYVCEPEPTYKVECVARNYGYIEGLFWSSKNNVLYWTDSSTSTIYGRNELTGEIGSQHLVELDGQNVTCVVPLLNKTKEFLICSGPDFRILTIYSHDNYSLSQPFFSVAPGTEIFKAHTDVANRMVISTQATNSSVTMDEKIISKQNGQPPEQMLSVTRVIDFCFYDEQFYGVGHDYNCIHEFDYCAEYGVFCGNQLIIYKAENRITCIEVDNKRNEYYCVPYGVFRRNEFNSYNNGTTYVPAQNLTSATFGGTFLNHLYVGSSSLPGTAGDDAGCLFKITGMTGHGQEDFLTDVTS